MRSQPPPPNPAPSGVSRFLESPFCWFGQGPQKTLSPPRAGFFFWSNQPVIRLSAILLQGLAWLFLAAPVSGVANAQTWSSTRTTTYDYSCTDADGKVISGHTRIDTAFAACANLSLQDGQTRYVVGGRYRITATTAAQTPQTCTSPQPATETRSQLCPSGTTGQWSQTRAYASAPYPTCWTVGDWAPPSAPSGACIPITGSATLSWTPPTQNTDGTALTNLSGYQILYGVSATALSNTISVNNPAVSTYVVEGLTRGQTYFFAVKSIAGSTESALSNVASKVIQ